MMRRVHSFEIDDAGIAMVYFEPPTPGLSVDQKELIEDSVIADYAADGRIVAIEILDPRLTEKFFGKAFKSMFSQLHIA
jgi:uncharacterized protein YuzE